MRATPSFSRIVWTDYWAFLSLVGFLVSWAMYGAIVGFKFMPLSRAPFFFWFAVAATVVGIPGLILRTSSIRATFEGGVQVEGIITAVVFYKDRGRAEFSYTYQGQRYQGGNPLHKTERAKALYQGQHVTLVVDPQKPGKAFIQELYLDEQ